MSPQKLLHSCPSAVEHYQVGSKSGNPVFLPHGSWCLDSCTTPLPCHYHHGLLEQNHSVPVCILGPWIDGASLQWFVIFSIFRRKTNIFFLSTAKRTAPSWKVTMWIVFSDLPLHIHYQAICPGLSWKPLWLLPSDSSGGMIHPSCSSVLRLLGISAANAVALSQLSLSFLLNHNYYKILTKSHLP